MTRLQNGKEPVAFQLSHEEIDWTGLIRFAQRIVEQDAATIAHQLEVSSGEDLQFLNLLFRDDVLEAMLALAPVAEPARAATSDEADPAAAVISSPPAEIVAADSRTPAELQHDARGALLMSKPIDGLDPNIIAAQEADPAASSPTPLMMDDAELVEAIQHLQLALAPAPLLPPVELIG